jgi:hypothetical protein
MFTETLGTHVWRSLALDLRGRPFERPPMSGTVPQNKPNAHGRISISGFPITNCELYMTQCVWGDTPTPNEST